MICLDLLWMYARVNANFCKCLVFVLPTFSHVMNVPIALYVQSHVQPPFPAPLCHILCMLNALCHKIASKLRKVGAAVVFAINKCAKSI